MGWREETQAKLKDKSAGNKYKLTEGSNTFRILPSAKAIETDNYTKYRSFKEYLIHRNVGPKKSLVRCGKDINTKQGECWLCDEIVEKYSKSGKSAKRLVAKQLAPVEQVFMQVARWDKETESLRGPFKFYVPGGSGATSLSVKLLGMLSGMGTSRHYDHPKKGYNISITRTGTGPTDTRYGAPEGDPERSEVPKSILRKVMPWDEALPQYDENIQRALFYGEDLQSLSRRSKIKEEEDEDMPMKKKKKMKDEDEDVKKKKKKLKDEDEDEEEDDEDEEEEDDEEEDDDEPKKKKKKKKSSDDDDDDEEEDDDEEDDDEDDDEDEVKKKKKKKKSSDDDDDEDEDEDEEEDDEDEDEDDEDVKKKKKKKKKSKSDDDDEDEPKKKKKKKSSDDDDEDEDEEEEEDDEDDEDEDEDEPKKKKGKRGRPAGSKNKKKKDDDDD